MPNNFESAMGEPPAIVISDESSTHESADIPPELGTIAAWRAWQVSSDRVKKSNSNKVARIFGFMHFFLSINNHNPVLSNF